MDDGTRTVAESLESLAGLYREGVRSVVTTPHLLLPHLATSADVDRELARQRRAFDELATAAGGRTDLPELWLGQEYGRPTQRHFDEWCAGMVWAFPGDRCW